MEICNEDTPFSAIYDNEGTFLPTIIDSQESPFSTTIDNEDTHLPLIMNY